MEKGLDLFQTQIGGEKKNVVDETKKVKVGIIGTGWIAHNHMDAFLLCPDVEIVAGADLVPGKADAFFKEFGMEGVRTYGSHKEMLEAEDLDCVSICTYNATHAECTIDSLKHGLHVLLEKPMCVTLEEAIAIRKAEKESGKIVSVGFQPRFDPNMQMIKKVVQSGTLGEVYYVQTGGGRRRGIPTPFGTSFIAKDTGVIGAMGDIGCYSLDMVLNALGYPKPLTVSGYTSDFIGKNPKYSNMPYSDKFEVEDFAAGFIRLEGGIILDFRISWAMHMDTPGDTLILGKDAGLRIPSTDCWNGTFDKPLTVYHDMAGERVETKIPLITKPSDDPKEGCFYKKIRSFVDACKNGTESPVPTSQIIYNQAIIDGIVKSAKLGREIELDIPEI